MLSEELVELANKVYKFKTEFNDIEVKAANKGCPKKLYDTLSSFSNRDGGGVIIFGLNEEEGFKAVGVYDLNDLQKKVTEQCNQMYPPVRAVFTTAEFMGVNILSAEIPSIDIIERPCYYKGVGKSNGSYIRVGDADLPMTEYEIYSYEAFRKHVHDDERIIENASFDYFRKEKLQQYLLNMKIDKPSFSKLNDEQAYEMLSITKNNKPTLASVMNFAIYPQGYLPQLAIIAVVVAGEELGNTSDNGSRFIDNKRIEGTLKEMLDEAVGFCKRNMKVEMKLDENANRIDNFEYPIEAITEIILNALIHRDYSHFTEGTPIQIYMYSNRIEIHSPGGLYGRMTVEDLGKTRPDLRNPVLATMSEFLLNTENRYSGIPTIYREMEKHGLMKPVFENRRNEFVVTLYNKKQETNKDKEDNNINSSILEFCKTPKTRKEIMEFLGLTTVSYATKHYIQPLVDKGLLQLTIPSSPRSKHQSYFSPTPPYITSNTSKAYSHY